ncbi:hybrid sensor histidine kinase/response regulator transcription factor [Pedobacter cryophilus]|uniref:histidine kinase n=1 Tax=Pedobacter cryophilus TaxID=2571271 RepID=A0A4U1BUB6_9SPHI|nr:two-component regulator propeller domain-containing protein [Pedobacter cryophilus]TKB95732.1 response regulator [Pedobacter cryophilus]
MLNYLFNKSFFSFVVVCLLIANQAYCQNNEINFTSITSRSGLSSNTINVIAKDKYGFLWFGTEDGLNKYDGTNFTVYRHKQNDKTSLPVNAVSALYEDKKGNLWIGTDGGSLSVYDRKKDCFINFLNDEKANQINPIIRFINEDSFGKIWIGHFSGLTYINPNYENILKSKITNELSPFTASKIGLCFFEDSKKRIWIGTSSGLLLFDNNRKKFTTFDANSAVPKGMSNKAVKSITEDIYHNIWFATDDGLITLGNNRVNFINYSKTINTYLNDKLIYHVAANKGGKLWIGTDEGLNILDIKTNKISNYFPDSRNKNSLSTKSIRYVFIDKDDIHWLGTYQGGVNKYDKNLPIFHLKQSNPFDNYSLKAPVVTSFAKGSQSNLVYVGTDGGGLHLYDKKTGLFNHISIQANENYLNDLPIQALEKDKSNQLWIGTFSLGLFRYHTTTKAIKQFKKGNSDLSLSSNDVFAIKEDRKGNVWIGTNGNGLNVYNPLTEKIKKFSNEKDANQFSFLSSAYIRSIGEDKFGNIWIGSHGSGLGVYNPQSESIQVYTVNNSKLPANIVLSVLVTNSGEVLVGSMGGGVSIFNAKTKAFTSFSEEQGLANSVIYKLIEDKHGLIWCSTNLGISSFNLKTKKFKNYNFHNGLQNNNYVLGAGLLQTDGTVFFGGLDGLNYFDPSKLKIDEIIPRVILTELKIANKTINPGPDSPLEEHISIAKRIEIDYKQSFSINFVALDYTTPQQNKYSYKLEGFEKKWNFVESSKTASYTNLSPGEYVLKVRASNINGVWNSNPTSIIIYVKPPFWLTIYAYLFYLIAAVSILFYIRHRGIQKLKFDFALEQEKLKAKQQIEEERREAERLHEFDELKIKFLTNLSHEFRTPVSLIMGPVDQLIQHEKDSPYHFQLKIIRRNARRLLNLVNQLLDFGNLKTHEQKLNLAEGDFISFSKELSDSFKDLAERKQINFEFKSGIAFYFTSFDHDKIERILFNLLSNAFKFTLKGGEILLKIEESDGSQGIKLSVSDTGIGINPENKDKVFDRFFQDDSSKSILNQGSGIGLSIASEFVKMHGGTIEVESIIGKGSQFTIHFPFQRLTNLPVSEEEFESIDDESNVSILEDNSGLNIPDATLPVVLLVEDDDDFRFYLKDNLQSFYKIIEASNGKEGWQKVLSAHPQLVVSDISMPYFNGIELCSKIKSDKRTNHIPVMLLTALTGEENQLLGLETGANDYLTKPFNFEILNIKIRNLLTLNQRLRNTYSKQIKVSTTEVAVESQNEKLLNKVLQYIEDNLNNSQLSVEDMSKSIGMSRGSLYSKLLELTGETPVEFIRSVKLDKAAVLLEKSDLNVAQICYSVGFATPNYFARAFKSRFNMLPSEYINLKRNELNS